MNFVSFETAKRLKEAGFPQPAVVIFGMMLYKIIITGKYVDAVVDKFAHGLPLMDEYIFAPTAMDILRELPGWAITKGTEKYWTVWLPSFDPPDSDDMEFYDEKPAEACALAWLAIHEKKQ